MQALGADVVTEEHKTNLIDAVTGLGSRAVLGFSLSKDEGVRQFDQDVIRLNTRLQVNTILRIDASKVVSSHLTGLVMGSHARLRRLVG